MNLFLQVFTEFTALEQKPWILDGFEHKEASLINWQGEGKKGNWKIKTAVSGKTEVLIERRK